MAKRRILAGLVDLAIVAGWMVIALGLVAALGAWRVGLRNAVLGLEWHVLAMVFIVVPVGLAAGLVEGGRHRATPGKRAFGLRVSGQSSLKRVTGGRAIARNFLKYGPPVVLGYLAVLAVVDSGGAMEPADWTLVGIALAAFAFEVGGVFVGQGMTVYDAISGLRVADRGRRGVLDGRSGAGAAPRRAL